jgi:sensor domain CHASE-containing protein
MAAYDESIGGAQGAVSLAPLYADKSVIQITGTIVSGRVFTASILPNGGWQREQVSLVVYVALEVIVDEGT